MAKRSENDSGFEMTIKPYKIKKDESYMSDAQKEHFTAILNAWKDSLLVNINATVSHLKDESSQFADPNDRATQEEEFSLELRTRNRESKLVEKIDEALHSLTDGDYGHCEECGEEIGIRRLEARPTATLCIECKTLAEMREKQTGH